MKTEISLNAEIFSILSEISNKYPELSNFLNEMPITIPNESNVCISIEILENYYQSLFDLFNDYSISHTSNTWLQKVSEHHPNRNIL